MKLNKELNNLFLQILKRGKMTLIEAEQIIKHIDITIKEKQINRLLNNLLQ